MKTVVRPLLVLFSHLSGTDPLPSALGAYLLVSSLCVGLLIPDRPARAASVPISATASTSATPDTFPPPAQQSQQARPKVIRYAQRLMAQYDRDQSGDLIATEWVAMRGQPEILDSNRDGKVSLAEMIGHITAYSQSRRLGGDAETVGTLQPLAKQSAAVQGEQNGGEAGITKTGRSAQVAKPYYIPARLLPDGLPGWFTERDLNGDGQLSIAEYAPTRGRTTVATFNRLDTDHDGLLTPTECTNPK